MNILVYSEPWVEINSPFLREPWVRTLLKNEIRTLVKDFSAFRGEGVQLHFLGNEILVKRLKLMGPADVTYVSIPKAKLCEVAEDHAQAIRDLYKANDEGRSVRMAELVKDAVQVEPDLIISLTPSPFLEKAWSCPNVFFEVAWLSRPPYPKLQQWDLSKDHWRDGFIRRYFKAICMKTFTHHHELVLDFYRESLRPLFPEPAFLAELKRRYRKVVLLPLQYSRSIAFDLCCSFDSQLAFAEHVLAQTPHDIGVIVTAHKQYEDLTPDQVRYLKDKYPNYISNEEFKESVTQSQNLVPWVDGVVGVSTAVVMQAVFWQRPVCVIGESYMELFSEASDLQTFYRQLTEDASCARHDGVVYWALTEYFFPLSQMRDKEKLFQHLNKVILSNEVGIEALSRTGDEVLERWMVLLRDLSGNLSSNERVQVDHVIDFLKAMNGVEAISFDLFDTLVERPFDSVGDWFGYLGLKNGFDGNFNSLRISSEMREKEEKGEFVKIQDIYGRMQSECPGVEFVDEYAEDFKLLEPRELGRLLYAFAQVSGKRVYVTSDTYYEEPQIKAILEKNGYDNCKLLVSSTHGKSKADTKLFDVLKANESGTLLHIGDSERSDVVNAQKKKVRGKRLARDEERLIRYQPLNFLGRYINQKSMSQRTNDGVITSVAIKLLANAAGKTKIYANDPNSVAGDDIVRYGFILGAAFQSYADSVLDCAERYGCGQILYLARDAWLPYQINKGQRTLRHIYTPSSRKFFGIVSIFSFEDVLEVAYGNPFQQKSLKHFLNERFDIDDDDLAMISKTVDLTELVRIESGQRRTDVDAVLYLLKERILEKAAKQRNLLLEYLDEQGFVQGCKTLVVDIGCSTRVQNRVAKVLGLGDELVVGHYFSTDARAAALRNKNIFDTFYEGPVDDFSNSLNYRRDLPFFEMIFCNPNVGTVSSLSREGNGSIHWNTADEHCDVIVRLHEGVLKFAKDFAHRKERLGIQNLTLPPYVGRKLFFELTAHPGYYDVMLFKDVTYQNQYGGHMAVSLVGDFAILSNGKVQEGSPFKWRSAFSAVENYAVLRRPAPPPHRVEKAPVRQRASTLKSIERSRTQRLIAKLLRDPKGYVMDSKNPILKIVASMIR